MDKWEERLTAQAGAKLKLSNTEIRQMRELAMDNGPLGRLILFFLDSASELSQNVFNVDMAKPEGLQLFLEAQAQYKALQAAAAVLGSCLQPEDETAEQENAE